MIISRGGNSRIFSTDIIVQEINDLLHNNLDKNWLTSEWAKAEKGINSDVHPFVRMAFIAYEQIKELIGTEESGITEEIFGLFEMAYYINRFKITGTIGLEDRLRRFISTDYSSVKYEIQIAGTFSKRQYNVEFIEESAYKTPDILISNDNDKCEIECKCKDSEVSQIDYIRSIYNNTQTARKQFSKKYPGIISIEIDQNHFNGFLDEAKGLQEEICRALRSSSSISCILLTSKIIKEDSNDYIFRHRVIGFKNPNARFPIPEWLDRNLVYFLDNTDNK